MRKQAIVIGLGQFGMSLSRSLTQRGVEVMAIDENEERVRSASTFVASAVAFDATDEAALARAAPERRDVAVCAIGDENKEASIICTALLRQMGAPHIVARATDLTHERILLLVGAHEVVNPERAFGERFATRLLYSGVIDEVPLGSDLVIRELRAPPVFVGRTLIELALPKRHQLTVVAIRKKGERDVALPSPSARLDESDVLVVVAPAGAVAKLMERLS
jgi:trk system potassium uptake protein TrkA